VHVWVPIGGILIGSNGFIDGLTIGHILGAHIGFISRELEHKA
jgi:hypothetical protein|tara:strand:+ start:661 stop:789 length:129 start_codon:yes stop_codon:yes gene_type:complete